jgi:Protein of unknown function (DUF2958)
MQELRGTENEPDFLPVVKLFMPECGFVWLLTEVDPEQPDIAFGLSDLGMGCPELDSVSLSEIELAAEVRGLAVRRDPALFSRRALSPEVPFCC